MYKSKISIAILILVFFSPLVSASPEHRRDHDRHDRYERHEDEYRDGYRYERHGRQHRHDEYDKHRDHRHYAKVIRVRPIYETIRIEKPRRHCKHREHQHRDVTVVHQHSPESIIMGGIVGGIIGHELGHPVNREISTLAGVVIGSAIAHDATSVDYVYSEPRHHRNRVCHEHMRVIEKQKLTGYHVKYKYRGRIYHTRTEHHPGKRLPIRPGKRRVMY